MKISLILSVAALMTLCFFIFMIVLLIQGILKYIKSPKN